MKIHFTIALPSTLSSAKWSLSLTFSYKTCMALSPYLYFLHASPICSSRFGHPSSTSWGAEVIQLLFIPSAPLPCYLVPEYLHEGNFGLSGLFSDISNCLIFKWFRNFILQICPTFWSRDTNIHLILLRLLLDQSFYKWLIKLTTFCMKCYHKCTYAYSMKYLWSQANFLYYIEYF